MNWPWAGHELGQTWAVIAMGWAGWLWVVLAMGLSGDDLRRPFPGLAMGWPGHGLG
jgi:hypothetical protein